MRTKLVSALLAAALTGNVCADQTFAYVATVSGARVGEARVTVSEEEGRYRIFGRAWSTGLAELLAGFRSSFFASGRIVDGATLLDEYRLSQRDRERSREVHVASGRVSEIKDGRVRPERAAPPGPDMLTALFLQSVDSDTSRVAADCAATTGFHTGKHTYQLELRSIRNADMGNTPSAYSGRALRCDYWVTNDEDERSRAIVWLAEVAGLVVPVRAELSGGMNAGLYLAAN